MRDDKKMGHQICDQVNGPHSTETKQNEQQIRDDVELFSSSSGEKITMGECENEDVVPSTYLTGWRLQVATTALINLPLLIGNLA